ncbi:diacylglycerol kinase [Ruminiclostridium hungatei]|uniref:Diacylglycerol kinase n=1 Tax=Ruminiclostridium hungatei TaxID=48256 RepID=A0A1V4SQM5_RUMHU|nr:diacylglycerol kinase family protein [Ruminiclostridium hungatei]OPX45745.1 diacylglycerol kinase [Ruminiclostridium hungatei]
MKHIFIINPAAGKGKSVELVPFIQEYFKAREQEELLIEVTRYPGHAAEVARKHSEAGPCRIYSIGGDGTVNEIVNGMAGSSSALGVIPTGSGNDFIRSLHSETDVKTVITRTIEGMEKSIDLARVNDKYFINIASIGFDANVVYNAELFKKKPGITGSMAYLLSIIYTVFKHRICSIEVDIDGEKTAMNALLVAVANGRYYGGGIMPAPEAQLDDGLLDVCLVSEVSRLKILSLFPKYIKGRHGVIKQVSFKKCKKVKILSETEFSLNIDGEILTAKCADFEIIQSGIRVILPC